MKKIMFKYIYNCFNCERNQMQQMKKIQKKTDPVSDANADLMDDIEQHTYYYIFHTYKHTCIFLYTKLTTTYINQICVCFVLSAIANKIKT